MKGGGWLDLEFILNLVKTNGYMGLFLWLWLGVLVFPVPNEVIIMSVGYATSQALLHPFIAFFVVYLGIIASLTTYYIVGRLVGSPLLNYLKKKKRFSKTIDKSLKIMDKYHSLSLLFSYFLPGVRTFLPLLYGISLLSYKKFVLFAYSGALLWLLIAYSVGFLFGEHIDTILLYGQELITLLIIILLMGIFIKVKKRRKAKRKEKLKY